MPVMANNSTLSKF